MVQKMAITSPIPVLSGLMKFKYDRMHQSTENDENFGMWNSRNDYFFFAGISDYF